MNKAYPNDISDFERDGCVCLRELATPKQISALLERAQKLLEGSENPYTIVPSPDDTDEVFHDFVWNSDVAATAAALLGDSTLRLYSTEIFAKRPGAKEPLKWHNDISYYPFQSGGICSLWLALVDVSPEMSSMQFVPGSHKWGRMFKPHIPSVGESIKERVESADFETPPDFSALADEFPGAINLRNWNLKAGDAVAFTGWTLHHTGANLDATRDRIALSMRFLGTDVIYQQRSNTLPLSDELEAQLEPGKPVNGVWPHILVDGKPAQGRSFNAAKRFLEEQSDENAVRT